MSYLQFHHLSVHHLPRDTQHASLAYAVAILSVRPSHSCTVRTAEWNELVVVLEGMLML